LGTEWQCSRTLFVFTSCFHSSSHAPAPNERNGASILRAMPQYSSRRLRLQIPTARCQSPSYSPNRHRPIDADKTFALALGFFVDGAPSPSELTRPA
jgi:hypothetical protein